MTEGMYSQVKGKPQLYDKLVRALLDDGYYFAAIPFAKEFLSSTRNNKVTTEFDSRLETLISEVGIKQFETLPDSILRRSDTPVIRYIRAKKLFRRGQYRKALAMVKGVSSSHSIAPFFYMLEGSIHSLLKNYGEALSRYEECERSADNKITSSKTFIRGKQYEMTRDYCTLGRARSLYALKNFEESSSVYLDIPKSSFVWPEILFEEAWVSYRNRNYNRALGKLVTYNAPLFENFFIPEIDVLRSLSYLGLCLYGDSKKTVDAFYQKYFEPAKKLNAFLKRKGKDYKFYYQVSKQVRKRDVEGGALFNRLLKSVVNEPGYQELQHTMSIGVSEFNRLKKAANSKAKRAILLGFKDTLILQKRLVGSYVRKQLILKYALLRKAFTQMSYVKLEVLSQRKSDLYYREYQISRERGDIQYLQRNEKQYFWTFNGEFWADELGDYVFALKSECK